MRTEIQLGQGIWIGKVVYKEDPWHLGRVQIRIPEVHGDDLIDPLDEIVPDENLPWARMLQFFGGFPDGGSHTPPPKGSIVAVIFEHGDMDRPWIVGGVPKHAYLEKEIQISPNDAVVYPELYGQSQIDESMSLWVPFESQGESELPQECRTDREETIYAIFKTPKGASIIVEEMDEKEYIRFIDRAGQILEFGSPVIEGMNAMNMERRGLRNKIDNDAVPYPSLVDMHAWIKLYDVAGQYLWFDALAETETIVIHGQDRPGSVINEIIFHNFPADPWIKAIDTDWQYLWLDAADDLVQLHGEGYMIIDNPDERLDYIGATMIRIVGEDKYQIIGGMNLDAITSDDIRIVGEDQFKVVGGTQVEVIMEEQVTVTGGARVKGIGGDQAEVIAGVFVALVGGDWFHYSMGNATLAAAANVNVVAAANVNVEAAANVNVLAGAVVNVEAAGACNVTAGGAVNVTAGGSITMAAGGSIIFA